MSSTLRGHPIAWRNGERVYTDTGEPTAYDKGGRRDWCGHCGLSDTPEGHDGCIGRLPGVMNACCGHGGDDAGAGPDVQFWDRSAISGEAATGKIEQLQRVTERLRRPMDTTGNQNEVSE